jgi:hypothetical protein
MSDAAEGFVLMSGMAAGLAYSPALPFQGPFWPGVARVWRRVWTLYLVHLLMTVWALGIAAGAALWLGSTRGLHVNEIQVLFREPLGLLVGIPLLTHQFGYVNILPMYAVMLAVAPAMLWLALRRPWVLAGVSGVLWFLTGLWEWNMPAFPNPGGWFFNPLAWQVIFVTGLLTGVMMRQGRRLVPVLGWLQWVAGGYLVLALLWARVPVVGDPLNHLMWLANQNGVDRFFTITDKTYVTWPRLLHILSLAYLLSTWGLGAARLCIRARCAFGDAGAQCTAGLRAGQPAGADVPGDQERRPPRTWAGYGADPGRAVASASAGLDQGSSVAEGALTVQMQNR